jgi:hypothetical protein
LSEREERAAAHNDPLTRMTGSRPMVRTQRCVAALEGSVYLRSEQIDRLVNNNQAGDPPIATGTLQP